jgi:hypothetical protein
MAVVDNLDINIGCYFELYFILAKVNNLYANLGLLYVFL